MDEQAENCRNRKEKDVMGLVCFRKFHAAKGFSSGGRDFTAVLCNDHPAAAEGWGLRAVASLGPRTWPACPQL